MVINVVIYLNMKWNVLVTDFCQAEESLLFKSIRESNKGEFMYIILYNEMLRISFFVFNCCEKKNLEIK